MDDKYLKKLDTLLNEAEKDKLLNKDAPCVRAMCVRGFALRTVYERLKDVRKIDEAVETVSNAMLKMYGTETAIKYTGMMMECIEREAVSSCLTKQEVTEIVTQEVYKLLMRGVLPKYAVHIGIRNAGKQIYEAHCERMTKRFFG